MFDLNEIKQRSQNKSYQLGYQLYQSGKVSRLVIAGNKVTAIVSGQHDYHVTLLKDETGQGESLQVSCSLPRCRVSGYLVNMWLPLLCW